MSLVKSCYYSIEAKSKIPCSAVAFTNTRLRRYISSVLRPANYSIISFSLSASRLNGTTIPQVKIVELPPSNVIPDYSDDQLFLPSPPTTSLSMSSLNVKAAADTNSLSSISQQSVTSNKKKKKSKIIRRVLKYFRPSKSEEAIMV